ncbi:hypothetical protein D9757_002047 [Collybiopsis confluens]|uniref:Uncharacterized protein n=1 Tax=Collybiopsis confluens TaxID=2823264 RepID=A0A8H5HXL6_9AGAR|nr:hypothetical protein D9757_002047 [Collybiopsis confluens]
MSPLSSESEPWSRSSTTSQSFSLVGDSDDEIVWDISSDYRSSEDNESAESSQDSSDAEDFVLLSRPHSPRAHTLSGLATPNASHLPPSVSAITSDLARLSIHQLDKSRRSSSAKAHVKDASSPLPSIANIGILETSKNCGRQRPRKEGRKSKRKAMDKERGNDHDVKAPGSRPVFGSRPIVDDVSESGVSNTVENEDFSEYEGAVEYITSFLRNPSAYNGRSSRLMLLQSLIIELGLSSSSMPASLTSAQALLKAQVFLNIREYLAVRGQGPEALKEAIYPSRSALIRSIRKQPKTRASLEWVKEHGLSVLLVTAFHH